MAMTLRLSEEDDRLLTERAAQERRSKHDIVTEAVHTFLTERQQRFDELLAQTLEEDKEILDRLAK
ncbi:ribbon-helix-helix protein, CopG family [Glycomyces sp. L485]|uniref:ribbon-helix-helix protein, CopG family n=1 Tax=Glycomyces sp. L485 TaxID=2909235 RepID=UPI001F4AE3A5|nr:ribbon-helix-helix protein, CopG family [Glycomyces sp. L485]MCH7231984.1 ribbon-helix-helix protein, CopG family [Glycomyces sp. L485]